jgi:hypothetical protein
MWPGTLPATSSFKLYELYYYRLFCYTISFIRSHSEAKVKPGLLAHKLIKMRYGDAIILTLNKEKKEDRRTATLLRVLQHYGVCRVTRRIWWKKNKFRVERTRRRRE